MRNKIAMPPKAGGVPTKAGKPSALYKMKGVAPSHLQPYPAVTKAPEGSPPASAMALHESGLAVAYAEAPAFGEGEIPERWESRVASRLVAEVAHDGSDVKALCEDYDLKREELGRLTGFSLRALADWASGELPSQPAKRRLHEVRRLLEALSEIVKRERIPDWLHQRNAAFGDLTPLQVIEVGEIDRLWGWFTIWERGNWSEPSADAVRRGPVPWLAGMARRHTTESTPPGFARLG